MNFDITIGIDRDGDIMVNITDGSRLHRFWFLAVNMDDPGYFEESLAHLLFTLDEIEAKWK